MTTPSMKVFIFEKIAKKTAKIRIFQKKSLFNKKTRFEKFRK